MKFDINALRQIPINEVLETLGARYPKGIRPGRRQFNMHCFGPTHKKGDKHPSLAVWTDKNICKCYVCSDIKGDPINVAKTAFNGDFKQACEWLHSTWGIPYKAEEKGIIGAIKRNFRKLVAPEPPKKEKKEHKVVYWSFDKEREFKKIKIKEILPKYLQMDKEERLKTVYTLIYRYSLQTNQSKKIDYYGSRGIFKHPRFVQIGTLSWKDMKKLYQILIKYFPVEDLVKFKIIKEADAEKRPLEWRYYNPLGFLVIPSFDLYSDMVTGMMLRPLKKVEGVKAKEFNISVPEIISLPFGLDGNLLKNTGPAFITEGHIDALSLPPSFNFIAVPGVQNIRDEWLGLLKGRECIIAFDQDDAGQNSASELKKRLEKAGAKANILTWDKHYGKDINELLVNGNLEKII